MSAQSVGGASTAYTYRPSLLGTPWAFELTEHGIDWTAGNRSGHVAFRAIRRVRMSYRPANMQSYRFVTEIWADGAPKLQIVSSSWKSMVEQERLDDAYSAFVAGLHRRIAASGAPVRFEQGSNAIKYWVGLAVITALTVGLCVLIVRALQANAMGGAAFIAAFLALVLWQSLNFLRRNRPGVYRPDALPPTLMPKR
jgi:hypothetical protein